MKWLVGESMKCRKCGGDIIEDTRDPAIHYSYQDICWRCEKLNLKSSSYYQDKDGNYIKKDKN